MFDFNNITHYVPRGELLVQTIWQPMTTTVAAETPQLARTYQLPLPYYPQSYGIATETVDTDKCPGVVNILTPDCPPDDALIDNPFLYYDGKYPLEPLPPEVDKNGVKCLVYRLSLRDYLKDQESRVCPHCGLKGTLVVNGYKSKDLIYYPSGPFPSYIREELPHWKCTKCNCKRVEPSVARFERHRLTKQVAEMFCHILRSGYKGDIRTLSWLMYLDEHVGADLLDYCGEHGPDAFAAFPDPIKRTRDNITELGACNLKPPTEKLKIVMVDEFATSGNRLITHFLIFPENGKREALFYDEGHGNGAIDKFVEWAGDKLPEDVIFISDMNASFVSRMRQHRPKGRYVHDRFHHEQNSRKHCGSELNSTAWNLAAAGRVDDAKFLLDRKTDRVLFTIDLGELKAEEKERFDKAMALDERIPVIRKCVVELHLAFESDTTEEALGHFNQHLLCCDKLQELNHSVHPERVKLRTELTDYLIEQGLKPKPAPDPEANKPITLRHAKYNSPKPPKSKGSAHYCAAATLGYTTLTHFEELLNYVRYHVTTGPMEGANNLIKRLKSSSFGIKRFPRFYYRFKLIYEGMESLYQKITDKENCQDGTLMHQNNAFEP